ncbi:hypothetical protein [Streptomyces goshikiensis]|uniref:hypothetical protein n=1 Tax=Streptomyces goshikiensis TaxID=1942 RepID=UPI0037F29F87
MLRLITAARLCRLTRASSYADLRVQGALKDAESAARLTKAAQADTVRIEGAHRTLCETLTAEREAAARTAADVRMLAFDVVASLLDDKLTDDERRNEIARLLVARRELLGLDTMPQPIWRHVADIARRDGEQDEPEPVVEVSGSTAPAAVLPVTSTTPTD